MTFPKDTDAANALKTGKVDAYFGDAPVVAYYIEQDPSSFAIGGTPVNPISIGIAIRKSDTELQAAVKKAVDRGVCRRNDGHDPDEVEARQGCRETAAVIDARLHRLAHSLGTDLPP